MSPFLFRSGLCVFGLLSQTSGVTRGVIAGDRGAAGGRRVPRC